MTGSLVVPLHNVFRIANAMTKRTANEPFNSLYVFIVKLNVILSIDVFCNVLNCLHMFACTHTYIQSPLGPYWPPA